MIWGEGGNSDSPRGIIDVVFLYKSHKSKASEVCVCVCVFCLYFLCFPSLNFGSFVFNQSKQFASFILISRYDKGTPSFTGTGTDSFQAKQSLGML